MENTPVLYTAESKVYEGNTLKDEYTTRFGIRTLEIVPGKGFFLNGYLRSSYPGKIFSIDFLYVLSFI